MRWLSLRVGGKKWGVHLVNPGHKRLKGDPDETIHAICFYDECKIYIERGPQEVVEELLLHELKHVIFNESGASHEIGNPKKEEKIIRDIVPLEHRLLKDLGLRFPKVSP